MIRNIIYYISTYGKMFEGVEKYIINESSRMISYSGRLQDMRLEKMSSKDYVFVN